MTAHTLVGGRFGTERLRDLPILGLAASWFFGAGAIKPRRVAKDPVRFAAEAARWSRSVLRWLDPDIHIVGMDRVDWAKPHVVLPLHEGMVDPLLLLASLPTPLRFVARDELTTWPVIGKTLAPSGQILITPEHPRPAACALLREGRAALAAGFSPVVFAQGTLLGIETAFEAGAFRLACTAGVEIVPVVIAGTHRMYEWPFSPVVRRRQPVYVEVLDPSPPTNMPSLQADMKRRALGNRHAPVRHFEPDRDGWWDDYRYEISPDHPELAAAVAGRRAGHVPSGRLTV